MTFWKRLFGKNFPQKQRRYATERESAQAEMSALFSPDKEYSKYLRKGILPRYYQKGMNCFLDSISDAALRQAAYGIPKKGLVRMMLEGSKIEMTFFFKQTRLRSGREVGQRSIEGPLLMTK